MPFKPQKPVIFLAFADDPQDQARFQRNLPEELRHIREQLLIVEEKGLCEVVVRTSATVGTLRDVFQDLRYRNRIAVFHFSGHAGGYTLLAASAADSTGLARADGLADFLGQQNGLQLVFLNGCSTEPQAEKLLQAGIPAVIATSESIEDEMAMELTSRFYAGLAGGASIQTAYREAITAIKTSRGKDSARNTVSRRSNAVHNPIEISTRDFLDLSPPQTDRWPWELYVGEGFEIVKMWNLPEASGDVLFGLPALEKQDLPQSPYRHLLWFGEKDAELFFGRAREIRALYEMVTSSDDAPIILLYGQTGVGKSSLLASGLLPRIKQTHKELYIRQEIGLGMLGTLAHALKITNPASATVDMIKQAWLWHEHKHNKPLVLALDQVEEIFTRLGPEQLAKHLADFLDVLKNLFAVKEGGPKGKLILCFSKEWLPDMEAACKDARLYFSRFFLKQLDRNGVLEAIEGASRSERLQRHFGLQIEEGLAELIADDLLDDPDSPLGPTLQILLSKMWQLARQIDLKEPALTAALYHSLKGRGITLSDFVIEQLANIEERYPELSNDGFILDVLAQHTTPQGTAATCDIETLFDLYDHQKKYLPLVLKELQELYLVVPVELQVNGLADPATRLTHDTLAPVVQQLHHNSDRTGQRALRILENRASEWNEGQVGALLDEADLKLVESGKAGMRDWTYDEQRLILASQRWRAQRQRTRNWVRLGAVAAVVFITVFGLYARAQLEMAERQTEEATRQQQIAEQQAQEAVQAKILAEREQAEAVRQQLIAEQNVQEALSKTNPAAAFWQNNAAEQTKETLLISPITQDQILKDQRAEKDEQQVAPQQQISGQQRVAAEGRTVTVSYNRRRTLGLALSRQAALRLSSGDHEIAALLAREAFEFNRENNGEFINEVYDALRQSLNAVDGDRGGPLTIHPPHDARVRTMDYSPADNWIASTGSNGNVYLWPAEATPGEIKILPASEHSLIRVLQFNLQGNLLATASDDQQLKIWENHNSKFEEIFHFDTGGAVRSLAFHPGGNQVALATEDNAIYIIQVKDNASRPLPAIKTDGFVVQSLAFSDDGRWLVAGDNSGYLHVWSGDNLTEAPTIVQAHRGAVRTLAFNKSLFVSGGEDARAGLWKIDAQGTPRLIEFLRGHDGPVNTAAFSPDGTQLATGSSDQTVRLWRVDRAGAELPIILNEHSSWIEWVNFSADGRTLISGGADHTVHLWRINPDELAQDICNAVPKSLNKAAWKTYAGEGVDYPDSCKSTNSARTTTGLRQ